MELINSIGGFTLVSAVQASLKGLNWNGRILYGTLASLMMGAPIAGPK